MSQIETVKKYIGLGVSVIKLGANKVPIGSWKPFQGKFMSEAQVEKNFNPEAPAIGIVCGEVSGNLEALDLDCKYDLTGTLFEDYRDRVNPEIFKKLVIQATVNGGYHLLYRCRRIEGNQKLAERPATEEERRNGEKVKVLIETRGIGGYIAAYPTPGYKFIEKHLHQIPEISPEERDHLLNTAREFNQNFKGDQIVHHATPKDGELSPLEDYNERGDVLALLVKHGWKIVSNDGKNALLRRPGKDEGHSAGYRHADKWFTVFSTSTEFDSLKAHLPYAVYAVLECNKDFSEASRRLRAEGYGAAREPVQTKEKKIIKNLEKYLSVDDEDLVYLRLARDGKIPMGLSTGILKLDEHFLFKQGNLVIVNGHDNVGKTLVMLFLAVLSAKKHEWSWIIYAGENRNGYVKRKIIELYYCKPITALTNEELENGYQWVKKHFALIANKDAYNYKNLITIAEQLFEEKEYQAFLIDPYNSLDLDMEPFSKLSTHEYHYKGTGELRLFKERHNCSVYINCHAVTEALRRTHAKGHKYEGFPMPPGKADTEGGGKFSNRADDFFTVHRYVQHATDWMWTEIHVRKIKETETGGIATPMDSPVRIRIVKGNCGFESDDGFNPVLDSYTPQISIITPNRIVSEPVHPGSRFEFNYDSDDDSPPF